MRKVFLAAFAVVPLLGAAFGRIPKSLVRSPKQRNAHTTCRKEGGDAEVATGAEKAEPTGVSATEAEDAEPAEIEVGRDGGLETPERVAQEKELLLLEVDALRGERAAVREQAAQERRAMEEERKGTLEQLLMLESELREVELEKREVERKKQDAEDELFALEEALEEKKLAVELYQKENEEAINVPENSASNVRFYKAAHKRSQVVYQRLKQTLERTEALLERALEENKDLELALLEKGPDEEEKEQDYSMLGFDKQLKECLRDITEIMALRKREEALHHMYSSDIWDKVVQCYRRIEGKPGEQEMKDVFDPLLWAAITYRDAYEAEESEGSEEEESEGKCKGNCLYEAHSSVRKKALELSDKLELLVLLS